MGWVVEGCRVRYVELLPEINVDQECTSRWWELQGAPWRRLGACVWRYRQRGNQDAGRWRGITTELGIDRIDSHAKLQGIWWAVRALARLRGLGVLSEEHWSTTPTTCAGPSPTKSVGQPREDCTIRRWCEGGMGRLAQRYRERWLSFVTEVGLINK